MDKKIIKIIEQAVSKIIKTNVDPLDGDETEEIACLFHLYLDFDSGNLTEKEYDERINSIKAL